MIEDILPRYQETANGTKKSFTLPFDIIDSRYIMVYTNQTKQTSGFSINGQELVFDSAPVAGTVITVVRAIPIDWEDYSYGALNLDNIITLVIAKMQTLEEQVSRSLKVNIYDDSTQTVEFFLQQLADAQSVLESAQDKLNMITSTSNSAIANIESAKEEAVQTVLEQASIAESAADSATASANKAQTILDSVETARDDAINTFNENATSKTSEYDSNASAKLSTFNSNADSRTTIFNTNAQTKMDSIDASVKSAAGSASAAAASAEKAASFAVSIAQDLSTPSAETVPSTQAVADESSRITSIMAKLSEDNSFTGNNYFIASSDANSVLTTLIKGGSYVKLGNGLIICWGWSNAGTITFPIAFSNVYYQAALGAHGTPHVYISDQTTTSMQLVGGAAHWIAMGY